MSKFKLSSISMKKKLTRGLILLGFEIFQWYKFYNLFEILMIPQVNIKKNNKQTNKICDSNVRERKKIVGKTWVDS